MKTFTYIKQNQPILLKLKESMIDHQNLNSQLNSATAGNIVLHTTKILDNDIASRELVKKINIERERSDRLTVAKLNNISKPNKQDYKPKLLTEKYSLVPINSQQLTPAQTAFQRLSGNTLILR